MRIPRPLAWALVLAAIFTAGLLRQFHERTPAAPRAPAAVGSLLFAFVLFLLLVAARERRAGAVPGPGIRLGSLTPLLLLLIAEKWISISFYGPVIGGWLVPPGAPDALADAMYRALTGVGLLASCLLLAPMSRPAMVRTWATLSPRRILPGLAFAGGAVGASYALLAFGGFALGEPLATARAPLDRLGIWVLTGQALRALAEEAYYRGLVLREMERLAPRLGARSEAARRWTALLPSAVLFGMEHVTLLPNLSVASREAVFSMALGTLFGLLALATRNLWLVAGVHAWINALLLGIAPRFVLSDGSAALPAGTYVAVVLAFAFLAAWLTARRRTAAPAAR